MLSSGPLFPTTGRFCDTFVGDKVRLIKSERNSPVVVIVFGVVSILVVVSLVIEYVADVDADVTVVDGVVVVDS